MSFQISTGTLSYEWLTSRSFTFRVHEGPVLSEAFVFHPGGFIVGYHHDNEHRWIIRDDQLEIHDRRGKATCIFSLRLAENGLSALQGAFRPPWEHYQPNGVVHILEPNALDLHSKIQSFDLFDTLVARKCFNPLEVFQQVEKKTGLIGFAACRHQVEMAMFGKVEYSFDDIYKAMVKQGSITQTQSDLLQQMELQQEWEMLFPIAEMVALVQKDDIVISDMYLPFAFVERILREKCGLQNKLYLSNYGKHHGTIWPKIKDNHPLREHYGDNPHADVASANAHNIPGNLVLNSKWSRAEEILHAAGLGDYAKALRIARLQHYETDVFTHRAAQTQFQINLPLLVLASYWLKSTAQFYKSDCILMAARDCNLWFDLLQTPHFARIGLPATRYLKISRTLCLSGSMEYEAYFRNHLGQHNLLVDMVGTGMSLLQFINATGLLNRVQPCLVTCEPPVAVAMAQYVDAFLYRDFPSTRLHLEALNASLEGSAVAARFNGVSIDILQAENEFSLQSRASIAAMRRAMECFAKSVTEENVAVAEPSLNILRSAATAILDLLPEHQLQIEDLINDQGRNLKQA